LVKFSQGYSQT